MAKKNKDQKAIDSRLEKLWGIQEELEIWLADMDADHDIEDCYTDESDKFGVSISEQFNKVNVALKVLAL